MYRAGKIGERADSWPTPISTLKKDETKLFYEYCIILPTK